MELLEALLNGVVAGFSAAIEAWLAHIWAVLIGLTWVALGSALGGTARFLVSGLVGRAIGETFPWGTLVVNVTGAFAIGMAAAAADSPAGFQNMASWHFAVVGILASYTTVSSFSLQTLALARDGDLVRAGGNALMSVVFCLSAVALGFLVGTSASGWRASS